MPRRFRGLIALLLVAGCSEPAPPENAAPGAARKVTLQLNWYPECEHGGYYAALAHGYFREEGLEVEILAGGPNTPVIQQVDTGRTTFGVVNADDVLLGRAAGADVVALLAPIQTSPRCVMVHEESGIETLEQLRDVTLAVGARTTFFQYLKRKLPLEGVRVVAYAGSVAPFLEDTRYAQQGYVFSEPFLARQAGANPRALMVADIGFNPYTSLLITRGSTIDADPDLVEKAVRASRRGWRKYLESPDETHAEILRVNREMNREALDYGVEALRPLCLPTGMAETEFGRMTAERWRTLAEQMVECELIDVGAVNAEVAFTTRFLQAPE